MTSRPLLFLLALATLATSVHASPPVGQIDFPNSGAPAAKADFRYGLAQLHNFEYEDAAAAFRRAQEADPGFAMAYWGEAMTHTHPIWMEQDRGAALKVLERLGVAPAARAAKAGTEREKAYLSALEVLYGEGEKEARDIAYSGAMEALHRRFPDDEDAAAFFGLSILGTAHAGRNFALYMKAAGVMEPYYAKHSDHPGLAHYLIHSYDDAIHAPLGLRAARVYAEIAPGAAHARHMTSHIFLALGMWPETVAANEAAMGAMNDGRVAKGQHGRGCGHYAFWLEYGYLQSGRAAEARRLLELCRVEASSEWAIGHDPLEADRSSVGSYAAMWARYLFDADSGLAEVVAWELPKTELPGPILTDAFTRLYFAVERQDKSAASKELARVRSARRGVEAIVAEKKLTDPSFARRAEILELQSEALMARLEGRLTEAITGLEKAAALEESLSYGFGPPLVEKPSHELLGELLLAAGEDDKAAKAFEQALARNPGRRQARAGLDASRAPTP